MGQVQLEHYNITELSSESLEEIYGGSDGHFFIGVAVGVLLCILLV